MGFDLRKLIKEKKISLADFNFITHCVGDTGYLVYNSQKKAKYHLTPEEFKFLKNKTQTITPEELKFFKK